MWLHQAAVTGDVVMGIRADVQNDGRTDKQTDGGKSAVWKLNAGILGLSGVEFIFCNGGALGILGEK